MVRHGIAYHLVLCHAMPWHAMQCHAKPYHTIPCHIMPDHVAPAISYNNIRCHTTQCNTITYNTVPYNDAMSSDAILYGTMHYSVTWHDRTQCDMMRPLRHDMRWCHNITWRIVPCNTLPWHNIIHRSITVPYRIVLYHAVSCRNYYDYAMISCCNII